MNLLSPLAQILMIVVVFCYALTQYSLEKARRQWKARFKEEMKRREAAEEANKAKAFFLTNMSHEIRAPLNAIVGFTDLALRTPLNPELRDYLSTVRSSADWLSHVVNEVVEFSRIDGGQVELTAEIFSLREIVKSAVHVARPLAEQKKLALQMHLGPGIPNQVRGDSTRLLQVLFNLIENALKFTSSGSVLVTVVVENSGWDYATFILAVADTGVGIAEERIPHLFEPLRTHSMDLDSQKRTCGFGLPICQRIVQSMGGEMQVQSRPGMGSRFQFAITLPLVPEKTAMAAAPKPALGNKPRRLRILLAEADAERRRLVAVLLRGAGHTVTEAMTGQDAVNLFTAGDFELVFVGSDMCDMDILTLIRSIRSTEPECRSAPIYALSKPSTEGTHDSTSEPFRVAGGTGWLPEPFSMESLLNLTSAVGNASAESAPGQLKASAPAGAGSSAASGPGLRLLSTEAV